MRKYLATIGAFLVGALLFVSTPVLADTIGQLQQWISSGGTLFPRNGQNVQVGNLTVTGTCSGCGGGGGGSVTGTGANTQVTFWDNANTIDGNSNFTYNSSTKVLQLGALPQNIPSASYNFQVTSTVNGLFDHTNAMGVELDVDPPAGLDRASLQGINFTVEYASTSVVTYGGSFKFAMEGSIGLDAPNSTWITDQVPVVGTIFQSAGTSTAGLYGLQGTLDLFGGTSTGFAVGIYTKPVVGGPGKYDNIAGIESAPISVAFGSPTVGNTYGALIYNPGVGTIQRALDVEGGQAYFNSGVVIGTNSTTQFDAPTGTLYVTSSSTFLGSILASGTTGVTPASGAGTRLMWIPAKSAFRAGFVDNNVWDDANIGIYSVGLGQDSKASGSNSAALGVNVTASGPNSAAVGTGSTASGDSSIAVGNANTASGVSSGVFGNAGINSGDYSVLIAGNGGNISGSRSIGLVSNTNGFIPGNNSIGMFANSPGTISGNGSIGMFVGNVPANLTQNNTIALMGGNVGVGTTTPGFDFVVQGNTYLNGNVAAGVNASAIGLNSTAIGENAVATALDAMAFGNNVTSTATAIAFGQNMQVNGKGSIGFGLSTSTAYSFNTESVFVVMGGSVGIGTTTPVSTFQVNGSFGTQYNLISDTTTLDNTYNFVAVTSTANAVGIILPTASTTIGREYTIKRISAGNSETILPTGSDTIDGASSLPIPAQYQSYTVVSDGVNQWFIK